MRQIIVRQISSEKKKPLKLYLPWTTKEAETDKKKNRWNVFLFRGKRVTKLSLVIWLR